MAQLRDSLFKSERKKRLVRAALSFLADLGEAHSSNVRPGPTHRIQWPMRCGRVESIVLVAMLFVLVFATRTTAHATEVRLSWPLGLPAPPYGQRKNGAEMSALVPLGKRLFFD